MGEVSEFGMCGNLRWSVFERPDRLGLGIHTIPSPSG